MVVARLDPAAWARLARLLLVDPISRRSEFDRQKDAAKAASLNRFKERLGLLADIDEIRPTEGLLEGVQPGKIAHVAGEARAPMSPTCARSRWKTNASPCGAEHDQ